MAEPVHRRENSEERPRTGNGPLRLTLNGASLTWRDLASALKAERVEVELDPVSRGQMLRAREAGLEILESNPGRRAYGWNPRNNSGSRSTCCVRTAPVWVRSCRAGCRDWP